ncbi:restriction endonuclease subunit S [Williamsia sp. CHRR-6]|uniref:restriction endonuclease subunit S n=1 Tax=Williamsia sp. CHRR-6 TaxID=2835871 RepID=UPI001BDB2F00|nr:restriction endonuclease subunit S [Williamsia sp. CHRR-6]MBT0566887.1 restriction endonuclease subunit S [Williamsia sp. CHRR-6]
MSRVDELISELCPDGVPTEPLSSIGKWFGGGTPTKDRADFWDGGNIPWVSPKDMGRRVVNTTIDTITELAVANSSTNLIPAPSVAVVVRSSILDRVFPTALVPIPVALNQDMKAVFPRDGILAGFIAHILSSRGGDILRSCSKSGGSVTSINSAQLYSFRIPVPPLEVQREIVQILDQFTQLEAELEAELEARRRQYRHYRAQIVSRSQSGDRLSLGELENRGTVKLGRGKVISKIDIANSPGRYPVYSSSGSGTGEFGRYGLYMFNDERITWSVDGGGRFFYRHPHRFSVTNVSGWMTIDSSVLRVKYLYYVLTVQWESQVFDYTRKAHPSVIRDVYELSVPPLHEQDKVVAQLDGFDALVNDLSVGLPAELAARRKQYEYYRDKLLTFDEAPS